MERKALFLVGDRNWSMQLKVTFGAIFFFFAAGRTLNQSHDRELEAGLAGQRVSSNGVMRFSADPCNCWASLAGKAVYSVR